MKHNKNITRWILSLTLVLSAASSSTFVFAEQFNALLITKTAGWHHPALIEGVNAIRSMSKKHFFKLTWQEDTNRIITDENLKDYDVIIFMLTTGDILNNQQQLVVERFIQSGKGFVGIHSASDTEYEWEWYTKLVGHTFVIHPPEVTAELNVISRKFPGLELMPDKRWWTDEWYEFGSANTEGLNYILTVNEETYDPKVQWGDKKGDGMGKFHPIAWYHNFDGGRSFYTALGHIPESYSDKLFQEHLYGGIFWAATGKGLRK